MSRGRAGAVAITERLMVYATQTGIDCPVERAVFIRDLLGFESWSRTLDYARGRVPSATASTKMLASVLVDIALDAIDQREASA